MQFPAGMPAPAPQLIPQPGNAIRQQEYHLPTIGQLIISTVGLAFFILGFIGLMLAALVSMGSGGDVNQTASFFAMAWTAGGAAVLMLPSMIYAILRLMGKSYQGNPFRGSDRYITLALFILPLVLVVGSLLAAGDGATLILASPLHLLVIGIPLWALFELSTRGLQRGSSQRGWGVLSFGLTLTPLLTMLVELLVIMLVMVVVIVWAVKSDPANMLVLNRLQMRLSYGGLNPEVLQRIMQSYVNQPFVFYSVLAIFSGLIPMVEEIMKPLALWLLINRRMSPMEGFSAGVISGLAFSIIESSNAMAMAINSSWAVMAIGRMGAGLLHMTTAGLMGWALASAFKDGRYLRLVTSFLLAVTLHGLWNGITVLMAVAPWLTADTFLKSLGQVAPFGLVLLMGTLLLILLGWNRILKRQAITTPEIPDSRNIP
jgi:hypothetical protein